MKRSFLEDFGIEKDVIDKIMEKNGSDINNAKTDNEALKKQISELKIELENKEASHKAEIESIKLDNVINNGLVKYNAKTEKAVKALLDMDKIKIDENGNVSGLTEQLEKLKDSEETSYLFNNIEFTGTDLGESSKEPEMNFDEMNYTQMCAYLENR
jgi:phage minor structural protein GP20